MATGFSNEKSAEYVVINDLYYKVKDKCSLFYPIIYQNKRDDTMISSQNNIDNLGLFICFARRPKVNNIYDDIYPKAIIQLNNNITKKENISFWTTIIEKFKRIGQY